MSFSKDSPYPVSYTHLDVYKRQVYDIINNNRFNQNPKKYSCDVCQTVNSLTGSYIAYVDEETFLENHNKYIDNAYDKSENDASGYDLTKSK